MKEKVMESAFELEERIKKSARNHRAQRITGDQMRLMRTCSWDIEATNLDADFGIILCSSIKPIGEDPIVMRLDETPGYNKRPWDDSLLARRIRDELEKYMVVIGWNHVGYDLPFVNSRLIKSDFKPIDASAICMVDMLWASRYRMRLHSNRLESVIEYLETKTQKTPLKGDLWIRAMAGDKAAMDKVVEHNIRDVESLEEVANKMSRFVKLQYKLVK
jgi:uncharacterized protein YprB with RNaseH-like and TPR domain